MPQTTVTARVALNRQAFDEITLAAADGLFAFAVQIVEAAHPPDDTPFGKGLVEGGGALAWAGKKKVNGTTIGGKQIKKPRAVRLQANEVTAIAGFGFPARFVELGTVHAHPEPFLTPAVAAVLPDAEVTVSKAMARRLSGSKLGRGERD
ncbi:MAG TPA: hypothetical protein VFV72_02585 [Candidatus Limnocylindrales bacterium]|nr:hypothetical protein [Candidatus Limnocylindrales bacterium]